jgi:cation diffusion facilitator family transporter
MSARTDEHRTAAATCAADPDRARPAVPHSEERRLRRWAWGLTALTIGWNSLEAVIAIVSGLLASSIALVGFGLDSVVEVSSAVVIAWRLSRQGPDQAANERAERRAVRLIALSFFAIAAYVTYDAVSKLLGIGDEPQHSGVGLALVALSVVVMPTLAWAKRRVAAGLGSVALQADAAETLLCTYLSVAVLVGLAGNSLFGWWWMDPLAGLATAALAIKEGREAWSSGELCRD